MRAGVERSDKRGEKRSSGASKVFLEYERN